MMKKKYLGLLILVFSFSVFHANAQERIVKGYVTTFDSIPLINVEVKALKSKSMVLTDSLGNFEIKCKSRDKLKVSAHGFKTRRVRIKDMTNFAMINLDLKTNRKSRDIAIGYGHVNDAEKLMAVSSLYNDDNSFSKYSNMWDLLRGQLPGVLIRNKEIIVRGQNSLTGSSAALIVVDGVTIESSALDMLNPFDVKSVSVLKDASTAIYGSRGASGVVIIEMKKAGD